MIVLAVNAKAQVILTRDLLNHLGVKPGERIQFDKLPNGELKARAAKPSGTISNFIGLLAGQSQKVMSIEEIDDIASLAWAGEE